MNMSDDVSGAVVGISSQVAQKGVETVMHVGDKVVDAIAKLLQAIGNKEQSGGKAPEVTSSDMTDISPEKVGIKELVANARKNNDSVVSTDGYSKADVKRITKKAKEFGIPVAFTNKKDKDNITAHVRGSDKAIFERICTENIKNKIAVRPQELDNFKAERWEIEGIQYELSKHDLPANWGKTKDGEFFCLFDKADSKAVKMAHREFVRKCNEVENDLTITKGEDGYYTLKDEKSGKEITFDRENHGGVSSLPAKNQLSEMFQEQFGYDENKANIACGKFGENHLDGDIKRNFFGNNPRNEFSDIQNHIELKNENILVKDYDCLRITHKSDGVPRIVFKDDNNNFAVLNPEKMSRKEMAAVIRESLNLDSEHDEKTVSALAEKADRVNDFYAKQNSANFTHSREFDNTEDNKKFDNVSKDVGNSVWTKKGKLENGIERLNKGEFAVTSTVNVKTGKEDFVKTTQNLVLSFSNKKAAIAELQQMYESQGVPSNVARQSAREVFAKAQAQSAEKVLQIEQIKTAKQSAEIHDTAKNAAMSSVVTVKYGNKTEDITIGGDRETTLTEIKDKFGVSDKEAETLLEKAKEKIDDNQESTARKEKDSKPQSETLNGHEKTPAEPVNLAAETPATPKTDIPKVTATKRK